jgi:predicted O-methyltransferase YrrM
MLPWLVARLKNTNHERDPEKLLSLVYEDFGGVIRPIQTRPEIRSLILELNKNPPERAMEIGTARGGTLFLFTRTTRDSGHVISVDLPGGWFGGGYPAWKKTIYKRFARPSQRLDLLRADSHDPATLERVSTLLNGALLDFLLIDGDHTYKGVKQDFEAYRRFVRPGGLVAFHDIVPNPHDPDNQVAQFWAELKESTSDVLEFVDDWEQGGQGIGIVRL